MCRKTAEMCRFVFIISIFVTNASNEQNSGKKCVENSEIDILKVLTEKNPKLYIGPVFFLRVLFLKHRFFHKPFVHGDRNLHRSGV